MTEDGDFFCAMAGVHVRDGMADLYRPFWGTSIFGKLGSFENTASDIHVLVHNVSYMRVNFLGIPTYR